MGEPSTSDRQLKVLVIGGIGSGKSTVMAAFERQGAIVIEADRIGHAVLEPGGSAHAAVAERWPAAVDDGRIDRKALAAIVFSDENELRELEALTHPHIFDEIKRMVEDAAPHPVVVELPLTVTLGESWTVVAVDADPTTRRARLEAAGWDVSDVEARMSVQPAGPAWRALADHVIHNAGSKEALEAESVALWRRLTAV